VSIDTAFVDWSGNCGNLSAAVGAFAVSNGLVDPERIPENGVCEVRVWQQNIGKTIVNRVPITNGQVQETGDFELDGVDLSRRRGAGRVRQPHRRRRGRCSRPAT
jgi:2-methylaconitate cis-trans-isomerase PrpF